jgi:hypothetical protein
VARIETYILADVYMLNGGDDHMPQLTIGDAAPSFTLPSVDGKDLNLTSFKGKR